MRKILLQIKVLLLLFLIQGAFAQNQTQKWYFGINAGLDFATSPPTVLTNGVINVTSGCSSISDAAGNLLFYTDGMNVYTKTHTLMANGSGLLGMQNPAQNAVIVKKPGSSTLYYIFTVYGNYNPAGMNYSTVDLSLAAGAGSVTVKNSPLYAGACSENLAAAKHGNGSDVWVVTHQSGNTNFRAFRVSAAGVSTTAVISAVGTSHTGSISPGYMKFSPNGKKAGIALAPNLPNASCFEIFDFNNLTGVLSNSLVVSTDFPIAFGCEFSPDGSKFYGTQGKIQTIPTNYNRIIQWDLCAGSNSAIVASQFTVASMTANTPLAMQVASDGKIYVAKWGQTSLGVINNPNAAGAACNYADAGQSIGTATCSFGLPNFVSGFFCVPSAPGTVPTFTESILNCGKVSFLSPTLSPVCTATGNSTSGLSWIFGDPLSGAADTSILASPTHSFYAPGIYTVNLVMQNNCKNDTVSKVITITEAIPNLSLSASPTICLGETAVLTASGASNYTWSPNVAAQTVSVSPLTTTTYTLIGASGTCTAQKEQTVTVNACLGITRVAGMAGIRVYPNPLTTQLVLELETPAKITVLNSLGQIVREASFWEGMVRINMESLPGGIYFIKAEMAGGTRVLEY